MKLKYIYRFIILLLLSMSSWQATLFSQITINILEPILKEGETTDAIISVKDPKPGQYLKVYAVDAEEILFDDTTLPISGSVDQSTPFVISLPITARSPIVVLSEYSIVAELSSMPEEVSITPISPGQLCSGSDLCHFPRPCGERGSGR